MAVQRSRGSCQTEVPVSILKKMEEAGATFREAKYHGKAHVYCKVGDAAATIYLDWIKVIHEDPNVQANWIPPGGVLPKLPNDALVVPLLMETHWIIHHCSGFRNDVHCVGGTSPAIGPPIPGVSPPGLQVPVQDASVAGTFLVQTLQNPPPAYATINSLEPGTLICTLQ